MEENNNKNKLLSILLNKYVSVWLWSILFGTTTGLTASFITFDYNREKWGVLSSLILFMFCIGGLTTFMAAFLLYLYLKKYLIPVFIFKKPIDCDDLKLKKYSNYLVRALFFIIFSTIVRFLITIINQIYSILYY